MGTRAGLILGIGLGYVLGARAGRERYEKIRAALRTIRSWPIVAKPIDAAADKTADMVRNKGNEISDAVADVVKEKVFGVQPEKGVLEVSIKDEPQTGGGVRQSARN